MILDDNYRSLEAVSSSGIKYFLNHGPKLYYDKFVDPARKEDPEKSTESTDIGDIVDCRLTTPELFDKYFYVSGDVKCSADVRAILDDTYRRVGAEAVFEADKTVDLTLVPGHLLKAAREHVMIESGQVGYQNKWLDHTLISKLTEIGSSYYKDLSTAGGRRIVDMSTDNTARVTEESLKQDTITGDILNEQSLRPIMISKQMMFTAIINGMPCKILVDHLRDNTEARFLWPRDIKTASSHEQFMISYYKYKYGYQGAFYTGVLKELYHGYHIAPFEFIVGTTDSGEDPLVYRMSPSELAVYTNGGTMKNGQVIRGWRQVLEDIAWHTKNGLWRYPRSYYADSYMTIDTYASASIDIRGFDTDTDIF